MEIYDTSKKEGVTHMIFERRIPDPDEIKEMYPLSAELEGIVAKRAEDIKEIFSGKSNKFILVI